MPLTNVGYGDSDELISVAYHFGVLHPSGYPLWNLLLALATRLPLPLSVAARAHWLTVLVSSLAMSLIYWSNWLLYRTGKRKLSGWIVFSPSWDELLLPFVATAWLGIARLWWIYSIVTEVFAFNHLLIAGMVLGSLQVYLRPRSSKWKLALAAAVGLSLAHHQTNILLLPAVGWLVYWSLMKSEGSWQLVIRRLLPWLGLSIVVWLATNLLLWLFDHSAYPSWQMRPGWYGWWAHITRKDFSGLVIESGGGGSAYVPKISFVQLQQVWPIYLKNLVQYFGWVAVGLILLGWKLAYDHFGKLFIWQMIGFGIAGFLFGGILGWPDQVAYQASLQRLYLIGLFSLFPSLLWGLWLAGHKLRQVIQVFVPSSRWAGLLTLWLLAGLWLVRVMMVYPEVNLRNYRFVSQMYSTILQQVEDDAVIACFTDVSCFALIYEQSVNQIKPNVVIVPRAYSLVYHLDRVQELNKFNDREDPMFTLDIIAWALHQGRPVYVVDLSDFYGRVLGLNEAFLYYVPRGYYAQITKQMPAEQVVPDYFLDQEIKQNLPPMWDKMRYWWAGNLMRNHVTNAVYHIKTGQRDLARDELNYATTMSRLLGRSEQDLKSLELYRRQIESGQKESRYQVNQKPISLSEFLDLIDRWIEKGKYQIAYKLSLGAVWVYPDQPDAHLALARSYWLMYKYRTNPNFRRVETGDLLPSVQMEIDRALQLQPDYQPALDLKQQILQELSDKAKPAA